MQPTIFHTPSLLQHVDSKPVSGALGYILGIWLGHDGEGSLYPCHNPTTPAPAKQQPFVLQISIPGPDYEGELARVTEDGTIYFCAHEHTRPVGEWSMLRP
jgi:hypothetical protein